MGSFGAYKLQNNTYSLNTGFLSTDPCENMPLPQLLTDYGVFDFTLDPLTFGIVDSWWPYTYRINQQTEYFPGNLAFNEKGRLANEVYSQKKVFQCKSEQEVSDVLKCGKIQGKKVSVRGGGHDFNGASLGGEWIISMKNFPKVHRQENGRIILSPNQRNGDLYKTNYQLSKKLNIVAGSCPTVGIAGYLLGGGHGFMTNYYGAATHYVEKVRMVTPEGDIKEVSDDTDSELMWALRGGKISDKAQQYLLGGHKLGVVTEFTLNYQSIPEHNWNIQVYNLANANIDQFRFNIRQFDKAIKSNKYWFTNLHFGNQGGQFMMRLWILAPSEGSNAQSLQQLRSSTDEWFPQSQSGFTFWTEVGDLPLYELNLKDLNQLGSIVTEYNYANRMNKFAVSYNWNSVESDGFSDDLLDQFTFAQVPERVQLTNYRFMQTGPYAKNSIYLNQSPNIAYMLQIYDPWDTNKLDQIVSLFKPVGENDTFNRKYINYPPTYGKINLDIFFGPSVGDRIRKVISNLDPNNVLFQSFN